MLGRDTATGFDKNDSVQPTKSTSVYLISSYSPESDFAKREKDIQLDLQVSGTLRRAGDKTSVCPAVPKVMYKSGAKFVRHEQSKNYGPGTETPGQKALDV